MKYLILILLVALTGCKSVMLVTKCRHVVHSQKAALEEYYPSRRVQIVGLQRRARDNEKPGIKHHAQCRIFINGKWQYLKNSHRHYHFFDKPDVDYKVTEIMYDSKENYK